MTWFRKFLCSWFHINCPDDNPTTQTTTTLPQTTTQTTTLIPIVEVLRNSAHAWGEVQKGDQMDGLFASTTNLYVHAQQGLSKKGKTLRCIHPLYVSRNDVGDLRAYVRTAKNEGCVGISLDDEGWAKKDINFHKELYSVCKSNNMICSCAPKATLDPGGEMQLGLPFNQAAKAYNDLCDILLLWKYDFTWTRWQQITRLYREAGCNRQIIPMSDGGMKGYITEQDAVEIVVNSHPLNISCGIFNPKQKWACINNINELYEK